MADNPKERGPQDRARVNIDQDYEVQYWIKKRGVNEGATRCAKSARHPPPSPGSWARAIRSRRSPRVRVAPVIGRNAAQGGVVPIPVPPPALLYVNVWKSKDGSFEAEAFALRDQALEEIGAGYPLMTYAGTVMLPTTGTAATFEDWSEEAHRHAMESTEEWLDEQGANGAHRDEVH